MPHFTKELLENLYWKKELSLKDIGEKYGVTASAIHFYMKKYRITRRKSTEPSNRTCKKISKAHKNAFKNGRIPWNRGVPRSDEEKRKLSESHKQLYKNGYVNPNKGKKFPNSPAKTLERREAASKRFKGKKHTPEQIRKRVIGYKNWCKENPTFFVGKSNPFYGKTHSEKSRGKMSLSRLGQKNHRWLGGYSFKDYPLEFNEVLKRKIRKRDNYVCQVCYEGGRTVHHIDYDKNNNNEKNLITVCKEDHINTNNNRDYWKTVLIEKINKIYDKHFI